MGKGDKRTKRGKLFRGSKGKAVPGRQPARAAKPEPKPAAKAPRAPREPKEPKEQPAAETAPAAES